MGKSKNIMWVITTEDLLATKNIDLSQWKNMRLLLLALELSSAFAADQYTGHALLAYAWGSTTPTLNRTDSASSHKHANHWPLLGTTTKQSILHKEKQIFFRAPETNNQVNEAQEAKNNEEQISKTVASAKKRQNCGMKKPSVATGRSMAWKKSRSLVWYLGQASKRKDKQIIWISTIEQLIINLMSVTQGLNNLWY